MIERIICLAGDGWGAIAAYTSLIKLFRAVEIVSDDSKLLNMSRPEDIKRHHLNEVISEKIICAGYKKIIGPEILNQKEFINIHYSLLPKYRGFHSTVWAILNGEKKLGLTIHRMNQYIDDGPVIFQYETENDGVSTATWYMEHFNSWIADNLHGVLQKYFEGLILPQPQNKELATWVGKRSLEDCKIDFSQSHDFLQQFFRALTPPYPRPFIRINNHDEILFVEQVSFIRRDVKTHTGRILNIDKEGIYVSSADGYVIIHKMIDSNGASYDDKKLKIGMFLDQKFL
ncbi:MAG TPA: formyltransferase family protein [Bacteroidales bacterium]|nr:formyltransferase family protein [Bacteroidales bacterium]